MCVTGLMTLPVFSHWSLFGQIILLMLIQAGGLGIIAVVFIIFVMLKRRISMRERILIHEAYSLDTFKGPGKALLRSFNGQLFRRLTIHSKLAIVTTLILLCVGTFMLLLAEWNNHATIGHMSLWQKVMAAMFQTVTDRTAGFFTIPQENFTDAGMIVNLVLMFIGGSPAGTAGGVRICNTGSKAGCIRCRSHAFAWHRKYGCRNCGHCF